MPKPINKNMTKLVKDYIFDRDGESLCQLSKKYKIDKATVSRFLNMNDVKKNPLAIEAEYYLRVGFKALGELIMSNDEQAHKLKKHADLIPSNLDLANDIVETVKNDNPYFEKEFRDLSNMMIKKSKEFLSKNNITTEDLKNISSVMSNVDKTIGIFPKVPKFMQQINVNNETNNNNKHKELTDAPKITVEFVTNGIKNK